VERIRNVPAAGPVRSIIVPIGLFVSQDDALFARQQLDRVALVGRAPTARRLTVESIWLTALGVGMFVQWVQ
jgi:hypothetical protein